MAQFRFLIPGNAIRVLDIILGLNTGTAFFLVAVATTASL